ncbi:MAG: beta-N-acetylhexosaminidase [Gracilimonas sp.]|uniref:beta-N-acetylhexosaminidase n=1 Tax=Gracilimonas sp. TaxID=1974203 RepID=UPI00198D27DE|nr:beta-N-acetylhexosaminidase [Gracilimonas sp.]MBD3616185.1 beta-N-acetylhexosaminidase [Gracilimonas sp.]
MSRKNHFYNFYSPLFLILTLILSGTVEAQNIIPKPVSIVQGEGVFELNDRTQIYISEESEELRFLGNYLNDLLYSATWMDHSIHLESSKPDSGIFLVIDQNAKFKNSEAYKLTVTPSTITISAPASTGLFYGVQTLRQLFPVSIEHNKPSLASNNQKWETPAVEITDYPRFEYRGLHLDVARHFFPVEFIKKYIDLLAMHKMNRFHWHLTEDQGWRIEIKKYPKLTEIGAWRDSTLIGHYGTDEYDNVRHGGFYTQEEIKEVVRYAGERHIIVIPEIEMPGHSSAALAAYPEFGCFEKEYHVQSTWGVFEDIYCPKEETFEFLEDVLTEVMELFPSKYIHIGGDEAPKKQWEESRLAQQVIEREGLKDEHELQSYFITRIEKFLNNHGRQIIGWDEILQGGLAPQATVMSWRGEAGGIEAAQMKHDVIMTPWSSNYFDHYQADPDTEPLAIGGFTTLKDVYHYEPIPEELNEEEAKYILGAQGNLWTEYMHSGDKVEYMAYPRAVALAEVLWSPISQKDWFSFWGRLQTHFERLDILEVNYARHYQGSKP